jgi:hypothetical protein
MPWKLVDANYLRDEGLRGYLSASTNNVAVLDPWSGIESYKGDPFTNISKSMRILMDYPSQVRVLKGDLDIVMHQERYGPRRPREALVDKKQTAEFPSFCDAVRASQRGDPEAYTAILDRGAAAKELLSQRLNGAGAILASIKEQSEITDSELLRRLRRGAPATDSDTQALLDRVCLIAIAMAERYPTAKRLLSGVDLSWFWLFRFALVGHILERRWLAAGGFDTVPAGKVANDLVDITHAANATYLDGFLTNDKKPQGIYTEAVSFLAGLKPTA